jgi:hypothetical protein|tara:strand:- start:3574 stop:3828 length:255 start_codon:yes stop_codon:yes gene_type:complete
MKTRGIRFRNWAFDYIALNGPQTSDALVSQVKTATGRKVRNKPSIFQVCHWMRVDNRFDAVGKSNSGSGGGPVKVWGLKGYKES